jgi:broad specificity phosphatase PhoE
MNLLLIRHALPHTVHDPAGADPELTAEGEAQSRALARALTEDRYGPVTAVVTSTMRRARQTAEPLVADLGIEPEEDARLVEFDHGWPHYGMGLEAYPTRAAAWQDLNAGRWGQQRFDPTAFAARVVAAIEDVVARHADGTVAVVCHGGVISAYLAHVLGAARSFFVSPAYASVSTVLAEQGGYREVVAVNESGWLPVR